MQRLVVVGHSFSLTELAHQQLVVLADFLHFAIAFFLVISFDCLIPVLCDLATNRLGLFNVELQRLYGFQDVLADRWDAFADQLTLPLL